MNRANRHSAHEPQFRVGVVPAKLREQVYSLRREAYANAPDLQLLDTQRLDWSQHDESGVVLGTWATAL